MVYLLDVDGTITKPGNDLLFKGIVEKVNSIYANGNTIWLFTCRPSNPIWENDLRKQGLRYEGIINKPFSEDGYVVVDDKLLAGMTGL